jgi:glucokinase-like ROK family protein
VESVQATGNQKLMKQINKRIVLQTIVKNGPISRANISQLTGLNKATVSSLVNELMRDQLTYESGIGESSGGRRPVMLVFNEKAGYSIGIDLGVNYILGILTDLNGNIITEKEVKFPSGTAYSFVMEELLNLITFLFNTSPSSRYGIVGIGIGVPGIVNKEGKVLLAPNLKWNNINLKQIIESKFRVPVLIDNEANAGAYGEKKFGAGKSYSNIIYVSAGVGIGVGIIINNELYQGKDGYAGEFGHMIIEVGGKKCACGSHGCWEMYASEHAIMEYAKDSEALRNVEHSLENIIDLAQSGCSDCIALFEKIAMYLGQGISNIINIFNPEQIIIGNRLVMAKQWIEKPTKDAIQNETLSFHLENLQLDFSSLSIYSAALGVAAFSTQNFLDGELLEI